MNRKTLRETFCEKLGIPAEDFERIVLWRCFYRRGLLLGKVLWMLKPSAFYSDLELIRALAGCARMEDVRAELAEHRLHHSSRGLSRRILRVRVSTQRLARFAAQFLEEEKRGFAEVDQGEDRAPNKQAGRANASL